MTEIRPGTIGFSRIGGWLGFWISLGQALTGDPSRYTHAFVVVDNGEVVEAMPSGARVAKLADRMHWTPLAWGNCVPVTEVERRDICEQARALVGTPYSFLDYLSLSLLAIGLRPDWLRRYVAGKGHMICSQLVDEVYRRAGVPLFLDGRPSGDVTPGDLANLMIERDWSRAAGGTPPI